jgi:outer membrane usher protein
MNKLGQDRSGRSGNVRIGMDHFLSKHGLLSTIPHWVITISLLTPMLTGCTGSIPPPAASHRQDVLSSSDAGKPYPEQAFLKSSPGHDADPEQAATKGGMPDNTEDVYKRLFGTAPPPIADAAYPIRLDGRNVADALMRNLKNDDAVMIERKPLLDALSSILQPDILELISKQSVKEASRDFIPVSALRSAGITVSFDRSELFLSVDVPVDKRTTMTIAMSGRNPETSTEKAITQEWFSSYLNIGAATSYVHQSADPSQEGRDPLLLDLLGAFNVGGAALVYRFSYDESDESRKWQRGDVTLRYDLVDPAVRLEAGDLTVPTVSFQSSPSLGGLSFFRDFRIQPYAKYQPTVRQEFEIEQSSRVQVYINGIFQREFRLRAGRYRLDDLPITSGFGNDIELRVVDEFGQEKTLRFLAFFDQELLDVGVADYGLSIGFSSENDDDGVRRYETDNPSLSGYARLGVVDNLTLGSNLQIDSKDWLVGLDALWASPIGSFGINAGVSDVNELDFAAGLQYRAVLPTTWNQTIDASALYTGRNFGSLGDNPGGTGNTAPAWTIRARYSQDLPWEMRGQLAGEYEIGRDDGDQYGIGATLSRRIGIASVFGSVQHTKDDRGMEDSVRIGLSLPLGNGSVSSSYDSRDNRSRVQYSNVASPGIGALGYTVGYDRDDEDDLAFGEVSYSGNRFEGSVAQTASSLLGKAGREIRTSAFLSTALAYAGGHVAISRPIRDSFAIVAANPAAGDVDLGVDPIRQFGSSDVAYNGVTDFLGPVVIPDLSSYFFRDIAVEAPDAPPGTSIGNEIFRVRPGLRSGIAIEVGSAGNVSALLTLTGPDALPIVRRSGRAIAVGTGRDEQAPRASSEGASSSRDGVSGDGDQEQGIVFFTNGAGRGYIEGLEPGRRYHIVIDGEPALEAFLDIEKEALGIIRPEHPLVMAHSSK